MATRPTQPASSDGWRMTIDSWIRDPAIRNFGLTALGMCLATTGLVVGLATGSLIAAIDVVLPAATTKVTVAGGLTLISAGSVLLRRHWVRRRRATTSHAATPAAEPPPAEFGG